MILFETLNQPYIFVWLIFGGLLGGLFFDFCLLVSFLCNDNKIIKNILLFIATIFSFFILFLINTKLNYGQIRIYPFLVFFTSLFIERFSIGKLFAKINIWCYTNFKKFTNIITKVKLKNKTNGKNKKQEKT